MGRDLTKGSITKNLWRLTWPSTISNTITMLGPTIDMIWVGSLGSVALAGVGISGMAVMVINSARMWLNTGTQVLIARFVIVVLCASASLRDVAFFIFELTRIFPSSILINLLQWPTYRWRCGTNNRPDRFNPTVSHFETCCLERTLSTVRSYDRSPNTNVITPRSEAAKPTMTAEDLTIRSSRNT